MQKRTYLKIDGNIVDESSSLSRATEPNFYFRVALEILESSIPMVLVFTESIEGFSSLG